MKAVWISEFGGPENLEIRNVPDPRKPVGSEVLVRVRSAGLNRADLMQRRGLYPPPQGVSPNIPGLEFAGEVAETGESVTAFTTGDRVFGITAGEAQAEYLLTDASLITKVPANLDLTAAGAVPEAFITAYDAVFSQAGLRSNETLLIHAVGSGVGLAGLQMAKAMGCDVIGTSRTAAKLDACREFGLDHAILQAEGIDFAESVKTETAGRGADVVLDLVGGAYFEQNIESLALRGRLMLVGLTAGAKSNFDLRTALSKRLKIIGTVLRGRSNKEKAAVTRTFRDEVVPLLESRTVRPVIDRIFPFDEVRSAHEYLESNDSFGKVVLEF